MTLGIWSILILGAVAAVVVAAGIVVILNLSSRKGE